MMWRLFRYVWFSILAMVLPSQALAYLAEGEAPVPTRYSAMRVAESAGVSVVCRETQKTTGSQKRASVPEPGSPQSETDANHSAFGILTQARWGYSTRYEEKPDRLNPQSASMADVVQPPRELNQPVVVELVRSTTVFAHSEHRLAGWKETNAMYVALNSQYS